MEVHAPSDWIAGVGRLIGADRKIAFFHCDLDRPSEIEQVADFLLVDFFND